jgi:hypothetical protein
MQVHPLEGKGSIQAGTDRDLIISYHRDQQVEEHFSWE